MGPSTALLHIRETLQESAQYCGRATTIPTISEALRARYGISPRKVRLKLETLKKDSSTSLHEHAVEVRIFRVAYADLLEDYQNRMRLEAFYNTLGNTYLLWYLLAAATTTFQKAMRVGNKF